MKIISICAACIIQPEYAVSVQWDLNAFNQVEGKPKYEIQITNATAEWRAGDTLNGKVREAIEKAKERSSDTNSMPSRD